MSSVKIEYGAVAVGAKEEFKATASEQAQWSDDASILEQSGVDFGNYGNPLELWSVLLDGSALPIDLSSQGKPLGWWSEQSAGTDGIMPDWDSPPTITLTAPDDTYFTSEGITLTFDTVNNVYPLFLGIEWYRDGEEISRKAFPPEGEMDNANYNQSNWFCENHVEGYNKVIIKFYQMNLPYNRAKLRAVEYGRRVTFLGDELKNIKVIQQIDPLSTEIPINTVDFTINDKHNTEYHFQEKQPITTYFDNKLIATTFVKTAKRKGEKVWEVSSEDYIGLLEDIPYMGGIYSNTLSYLNDISETAGIDFEIDPNFSHTLCQGYIPITSCREALLMVAFAAGLMVDTSNSNKIKLYLPSEETSQTIPPSRIWQNPSITDVAKATAVELYCYRYRDTDEIVTLYDANESGTGENIYLQFDEPYNDFAWENGANVSFNNFFAKFDANEGFKLTARKMRKDTCALRKEVDALEYGAKENVVSIKEATLYCPARVDKILDRCYNYYRLGQEINVKIVDGKHEAENGGYIYDQPTTVGDVVHIESVGYVKDVIGRIEKQTFNLNGGILVKDTVIK